VPDLTGAIYVPDYRALLVADLHFEKGTSRAARGVHLPPYDTRSTLSVLECLVACYQPVRMISLGDSFHDRHGPARLDDDDLARIIALSSRTDVIWLTGNHDPDLPGCIGGTVAGEAALGPVTLRHEPRIGAEREIAGHLHPVASVVRRGRKLTRKCFIASSSRLIMPALGAYTGGLNVWSDAYRALFADDAFNVWMLARTAIHRFAAKSLFR